MHVVGAHHGNAILDQLIICMLGPSSNTRRQVEKYGSAHDLVLVHGLGLSHVHVHDCDLFRVHVDWSVEWELFALLSAIFMEHLTSAFMIDLAGFISAASLIDHPM